MRFGMRSKRQKAMAYCLAANFAIFIFGLFKGADLTALGTGLAALNAPLYMYMWAETSRKSDSL